MQSTSISYQETQVAINSYLVPKLSYSLGVTRLTKSQARRIENAFMKTALNKMGMCSNFPRAVACQSNENGGLGFPNLYLASGLAKLNNFISHVRVNRSIGKILLNILTYHQLEVESSAYFLSKDYKTYCGYTSPSWVSCLWEFNTSAGIEINDTEMVDRRQREGDRYIMDLMDHLPMRKRTGINKVQKFLNLIVVSDIMTARGDKIEPSAVDSLSIDNLRGSKLLWPKYSEPSSSEWKSWKTIGLPIIGQITVGKWLQKSRHQRWKFHLVNPSTIRQRGSPDKFFVRDSEYNAPFFRKTTEFPPILYQKKISAIVRGTFRIMIRSEISLSSTPPAPILSPPSPQQNVRYSSITCASDGSVKNKTGFCGWALFVEDEVI